MTTIIDELDRDVSNLLCVHDRKGEIAITIGLIATVFFEEPWTQGNRDVVAALAREYMEMLGDKLRWARHPRTVVMHAIDSGRVALPWEWLPKHNDPETSWEFLFHGGVGEETASPYVVSAFGSNSIKKGLGFFRIALPLMWYADHPGSLPEFLRSICERLKPISGYGGLGIIESPDILARKPFQRTVRELAERFPGLDADAGPITSRRLGDGIKGVNWLTVLSDRWIDNVGGVEYLRARLNETFYFYRYKGGVIIQAGPKPQLGDVNANNWPRPYVTLAKVLKKIQITTHNPMHFGGTGGFDYEATLAWLFRFDGK
jgi:hypothetical protein